MFSNGIISLPLEDDDNPFPSFDCIESFDENDIDPNGCNYHLMDRVTIHDDGGVQYAHIDGIRLDYNIHQGAEETLENDDDDRNRDDGEQNGSSEEDEIQFTAIDQLPKTIASCYLLNNAYRVALELFRDRLEEKLQANLAMQEELLNSEAITNEHVYPNSLLKFLAPYFRDGKYFTPDDNDDTKSRKFSGAINTFYLRLKKPWKDSDSLNLRFAVQNFVTKQNMEPYTRRENHLMEEINRLKSQGASRVLIKEKTDLLDEKRHEIESIKETSSLPPRKQSNRIDWLEVSQHFPAIYTEFDCEIRWTNYDHPDINHGKWTLSEDKKLAFLVKGSGSHIDWDKIAADLGTGRVAWQCCQKYQSSLNPLLINSGPFTQEEIILLKKVVDKCSIGKYIPWGQVAYFMERRSMAQIKHFWAKSNTQGSRRGAKWTELENKVLSAAVQKLGTHNWKLVANYIPGRTNRQCRERYMLRVGIKDRKLADWTFNEDLKLVNEAPALKFRWVELMAHLTKRNARQIAARYDIIERCKITKTIETSKDLRDLVPRNKTFGKRNKIQELDLNFSEGQTIDDFLRESKKELENEIKNGKYRVKISRIGIGGRKKKALTEEMIEQELIRQFSLFSLMGKPNKPTKRLDRAGQETILFTALESIIHDYFSNKMPTDSNLLASVISSVLRKQVVGVNPERLVYCPPIFPPNLMTTQTFQTFLCMRQRLKQQLTDYNYDSSQYAWHPQYRSLISLIISLYFWPCLLSQQPPLSTKPSTDSLPSSIQSQLPSSQSSSPTKNTKSSSSNTRPSSKRRKKSQPTNIDHCNEIREKQRRLFSTYENNSN